jgi:hypothetical protein
MSNHDAIHDLRQGLNSTWLRSIGAKQRLDYEVVEQRWVSGESLDLKKSDHHGSELSKIFPVVSRPGTRGEHFPAGIWDAVLVGGACIQVFPGWQEIVCLEPVLWVLELSAVFRAAQVDTKEVRSRRASDKPSPLYTQKARNFTDIGSVGSVDVTLVDNKPFPAYLKEWRVLGWIAFAVRDATTFGARTITDGPRVRFCTVEFRLLSSKGYRALQICGQHMVENNSLSWLKRTI